jgi:hypothetical protein
MSATLHHPPLGLPASQLDALAGSGYAVGNLTRDVDRELTRSTAWRQLVRSWDQLPPDTYMADGGTYRQRRFSEIVCHGRSGELRLLPHRPFSQPLTINPLNGGVDRLFAPMEAATVGNPAFRRILLWYVRSFDRLEGPGPWLAQCFQNRTLARPGCPGLATPEGVHRDGMDYNVSILIRRRGVAGGVSRLYDAGSGAQLGQVLLADPSDHVVMDDRRLLHDVTPITLAGDGDPQPTPGARDALVISFTRMSG